MVEHYNDDRNVCVCAHVCKAVQLVVLCVSNRPPIWMNYALEIMLFIDSLGAYMALTTS